MFRRFFPIDRLEPHERAATLTMWLVGILQGVLARALQGNASNAKALETGKRTRPLAEQAWALAQQA